MKYCTSCNENITNAEIYYFGVFEEPLCDLCYRAVLQMGLEKGYEINDHIESAVGE